MNQWDAGAHATVAKMMTGKQLISIIKDIKAEMDEMSHYLSLSEISKYKDLLTIYENERVLRLSTQNNQKKPKTFH